MQREKRNAEHKSILDPISRCYDRAMKRLTLGFELAELKNAVVQLKDRSRTCCTNSGITVNFVAGLSCADSQATNKPGY